ncbi:MAG: hypothetical protein Q9212_006930 [Teloschistes hypoglaucus]
MADTLFDDDDDDFWIEDPYGEADDLAEHTMQSPVLVNWDPSIELEDGWTDWEYYSDDFWDEETPKRKRRKVVKDGSEHGQATARKRRRMKTGESIPELSLGEPATSDDEKVVRAEQPVVWKIRGNSPKPPTVEAGMEEKVSILKDWRERFKLQPSKAKDKATSNDMSQQSMDEVTEQQLGEDDDGEFDDNPVFYEDDESGETLRLPAGSSLPHDVRSMLQNQLLNLSDLSDPDPEDQFENHKTPRLPPNTTRKREQSISPDPAPEPISPPTPPSSKLPKGMAQAISNHPKVFQNTKQASEAATQQTGLTYHKNTENIPPSHKRKHSASPEPRAEEALHTDRKRVKHHSAHDNETSAEAKTSGDISAPKGEKKQKKKAISRKRKTPPTNEKEQESKRLKPESCGQDAALASGEKDTEANKAKDGPAEKKAKSPVKKENAKPKAAVPERRSTRRK